MIDYAKGYDFPSKSFRPMDNQKVRFNFLLNHSQAFDLSDMGTGKTATVLWAADYMQREIGGSVLILAGKTTLQTVWEKSCADILSNRVRFGILPHVGSQRAKYVGARANAFHISNYECLLSSDFRAAIAESDVHTIIVDECTAFKHANTSRSKFFRQVAIGRNVWGLTATPRPNSPLDCYGIARAIRQDYKESFNRFRDRTHLRKDMWLWVPKDSAEESAKAILQPSIRVTRDECYELPPCTTERRTINLSKGAANLYKTLRRDAFAQLGSGRSISVAHEAALRNKLLQVCGGAVYSEGGSVEYLDTGERATELLELLEQTDEKLVVFVPYRSQLLMVEKLLKEKGHATCTIHGDTKGVERGRIIEAFQSCRMPRVLVCDPRTMAHGVELTASSIIVWWLPIDSNELYQQAIGRLNRRGQTRHVKNVQLCATPLEAKIYDRLEARQSLQGALLEALETKEGHNETYPDRPKPSRADDRVSGA